MPTGGPPAVALGGLVAEQEAELEGFRRPDVFELRCRRGFAR
jgi:hypothetical protein